MKIDLLPPICQHLVSSLVSPFCCHNLRDIIFPLLLENIISYVGFLSRTFTVHMTTGEGGEYFFMSSLPRPPTSQTLRHQPGDYCRELTTAYSQQPDLNGNLWFQIQVTNHKATRPKKIQKSFILSFVISISCKIIDKRIIYTLNLYTISSWVPNKRLSPHPQLIFFKKFFIRILSPHGSRGKWGRLKPKTKIQKTKILKILNFEFLSQARVCSRIASNSPLLNTFKSYFCISLYAQILLEFCFKNTKSHF